MIKRSVFMPVTVADSGSRIISIEESRYVAEPVAVPAWQRRRVMACVINCR
ncbi:MAG: hypothetical protein HDT00_02065 [Bacteroidales bacterium]|nr:hypothetical protein [Bacteroidales bacterium]